MKLSAVGGREKAVSCRNCMNFKAESDSEVAALSDKLAAVVVPSDRGHGCKDLRKKIHIFIRLLHLAKIP